MNADDLKKRTKQFALRVIKSANWMEVIIEGKLLKERQVEPFSTKLTS